MSEVLLPWDIQEPQSFWMQQNTSFGPRLFDNSRIGGAYALHPGSDSLSAASSEWQPYGGEAQEEQYKTTTTTIPMTQPQQHPLTHTPHSRVKQNRRAFSHSHSAAQLYESRPSPYARGNLPQQSATFDSSSSPNSSAIFEPTTYENDQSTTSRQHLPTPSQTPSHTPTSDSFTLDRVYNKNRSKSVAQVDSHRGMQSNMLEQFTFDSNTPSRSPGLSVSSYGPDMPATPRTLNSDYGDDPYNAASGELNTYPFYDLDFDDSSYFDDTAMRPIPKVTRPMPDFYQDDVYNPINITSAPVHTHSSQPQKSSLLSPYRNMVNDRLQAANDMRALSPTGSGSRTASPFRQSSPYASSASLYGQMASSQGQAQQMNGHTYGQSSSQRLPQQHTGYQTESEEQQKTISPKDAVLDFHEPVDESTSSLFPENSAERRAFGSEINSYSRFHGGNQLSPSTYEIPQSQFTFQAPSNLPVSLSQSNSQEYRFPTTYRQSSNMSSVDQPDFPAHLAAMETTKSENNTPSQSLQSPVSRPLSTTANSGTYTCTYHGCTQRFASPALLQKHKKEGHRSTASRAKSQTPDDGSSPTSQYKNSQAGPHRCDHINPATGKPCNVVFSRPYDLTRHEDTIHAQRTKVRCQYCTEEKTFSRNDALTRHMRVVHPNISFPGKHRRRNVP